MKTLWKLFIGLLAPVFVLISCEQEAIDPLSGIYTPPEVYDFSVLSSQSREKDGNLYVFSVNLSDDASNALNLKLAAADYILPASDFTPSATVAKNTYLIGGEGSTCNGQEITDGTISIALQDSTYSINGIIYLADETVVKMTAGFTFAYQPDPYIPTFTYTDEKETPALGGADGTVAITGSTKHKLTIFADDEVYAYLEVVADENASSLSGTYSIKDGIDAVGQINNGYYLDWSWWGGAGTMEGGSYYMEAGDKYFLREGDGTITITDTDGTLNITGSNLGLLDLDALIASSGASWVNLETPGKITVIDATNIGGDEPAASLTYVNTITAPATYGWAGTAITGSQLNVIKIVSAGDTIASFELITDEGATDLSGDYDVVDGTVVTPVIGNANNGFYLDMTWYGMDGITIGGCYYMENGEARYIRAGSVVSVVDNGGTLSISGSDLVLLDVDALVNSSGATWSELSETGSCSFANVTPAN